MWTPNVQIYFCLICALKENTLKIPLYASVPNSEVINLGMSFLHIIDGLINNFKHILRVVFMPAIVRDGAEYFLWTDIARNPHNLPVLPGLLS